MANYLNIAMLGHKRIPSREGGIEIVVEELSTRMVKKGHKVTCYNRNGHHVSGAQYDTKVGNEYKGVRIKSVITINKKGLAALTSSFFAAIKSALGKYDIVHFHAEGPAAMCFIPKLCGKKVIVTIHGLDWARTKWGKFAKTYIKFGEIQAAKHADEIIVLSRSVQRYFEEKYGVKTTYIPNGVNRPEIVEADYITKEWGLEKESYVLFLGRIVPEKGLKYLLQAWKKVKTNKKLVIAGGSSDSNGFFNELKEMATGDIVFTGFQQGKALEELYSNAYLYVLPSDLEGMPLSLLEAMSYGNCCLVSDIPELTEVVEDKGIIFKRANVNDLSAKLQKALDDKKLVYHYKNIARDFICQNHNWDDLVEKTLDVYWRAIRRKKK